MSFDTRHANKDREALKELDEIWLFGYGSLIYKVDFPYLDKAPAFLSGWARRFWQGSHDHRGTPTRPGRVVTLIPSEGASCFGLAYKVTHEVFDHLDHREKNGYLRQHVALELHHPKQAAPFRITGVTYIADQENAAYLGPLPEYEIAEQIHQSQGPSGPNREYLLQLAQSLREWRAVDEHVFRIEAHLLELTDPTFRR